MTKNMNILINCAAVLDSNRFENIGPEKPGTSTGMQLTIKRSSGIKCNTSPFLIERSGCEKQLTLKYKAGLPANLVISEKTPINGYWSEIPKSRKRSESKAKPKHERNIPSHRLAASLTLRGLIINRYESRNTLPEHNERMTTLIMSQNYRILCFGQIRFSHAKNNKTLKGFCLQLLIPQNRINF